jgi:hypothetical protein
MFSKRFRRTGTDPNSTDQRKDRHTNPSLSHHHPALCCSPHSSLAVADSTCRLAVGSSLAEGSPAEDNPAAESRNSPGSLLDRSSLATGLGLDSMVVVRLAERKRDRRRSGLPRVEMGRRVVDPGVRPKLLLIYSGVFACQGVKSVRICGTFRKGW